MPSIPVLKINGLATADNPLSSVKDGSLRTADNVVIRSANILEPRRGQVAEALPFGNTLDRANALAFFGTGHVVHYGTTNLAQSTASAAPKGHTNDVGTISLWRLESATAPIVDEKGNHALTPLNTPSSVVGKINNGVAFSNVVSQQALRGTATANATSLAFLNTVTNEYTWEAWVYPTAMPGADAAANSVIGLSNGTTGVNLCLCNVGGLGAIKARWEINGGAGINGAITISQNVWTHIAVTRAWAGGANAEYKLYVNGVLDVTATRSDTTAASTHTWRIGENYNSARYFTGRVDDVRISSVCRSPTEVLASFNAGSTGGTTLYTPVSGVFIPPDAATLRMKFAEAAQNLYFTTNTGIKVLDRLTVAARSAGFPRMNDLETSLYGTPSESRNWLPANRAVAYRLTATVKDLNGKPHESPPSGRIVLVNPADVTTSVGLSRNGSNVVTATFAAPHGFKQFANISLTNPEASFGSGGTNGHNISSVATDGLSFTYTEVGAVATSSTGRIFSSGSKAATIGFSPPPTATTSTIYKLYRSDLSPNAATDPGDELYQVMEFTGVNPASDYATSDYTPQSSLYSTPLYTNPRTGSSGNGILGANDLPPMSKDICTWQDRLWFANTTTVQRVEIQMLGTTAPNGWQVGDYIDVGTDSLTVRYTAGTATAGNTVKVFTENGIARNTEDSAKELCRKISLNYLNGTSPVRAFYLSGADDAPGKILLEQPFVNSTPNETFTAAPSRSATWSPTTTVGFIYGQSEICPNRIYYSKFQEHEGVPLLNYLEVGAKNKAILRIAPLRDKLFVFKEDGIYAVSGDPGFGLRVDLLDSTTWLLAPDSVCASNNRLYCLTNQGICAVSEGGVGIISRGIENLFQSGFFAPIADQAPDVKRKVWACAYDSERSVIFGLTSSTTNPRTNSTYATQLFVFNYQLETWTRWPITRTIAAVDPVRDRLILGNPDANTLLAERKLFDVSDYADGTTAITITAVSATAGTITVSSSAGLVVGDGIVDANGTRGVITAINGNVLTVAFASPGTGLIPTGHINDASTVSLWRMESATSFTDEKGTNNLSPVGPPSIVTGKVDNAVMFNGAQSAVASATADATSLAMLGTTSQSYTWEAWIYPTNAPAPSDFQSSQILCLADGSSSVMGLNFVNFGASGNYKIRWDVENGSEVVSDANLALNTWHHIAVVKTGGASNYTITLYHNGVATSVATTRTNVITPAAHKWQISLGHSGRKFVGRVDDVRVSSVARSASEILASYNRGNTGAPPTYFTATTATAHTAIPVFVEFNPITASPATPKQFSEATLHFNNANISSYGTTFRTELSTSATVSTETTPGFAIYTSPSEIMNRRMFVPLEKQRGAICRIGLSVSEAWARWQLNGFTVEADGSAATRNSR